MKITILLDNIKSWYYPYAKKLVEQLSKEHEVFLVHNVDDIPSGELAFFLSCEKIIKEQIRKKNKHNIVVHSSSLPLGKGWSPLSWQILEGKNKVKNTLFEAVDKVDAGVIYLQNEMKFCGDELLNELHDIQGGKINELVFKFVSLYPDVEGKTQEGAETFYQRRNVVDSELDIDKSIKEQFNLLRIVDNKKYPAFFEYMDQEYILTIQKKA